MTEDEGRALLGFNLLRVALLTLPAVDPHDPNPMQESERLNRAARDHPLIHEMGLAESQGALAYVWNVQGWLMAVRWLAATSPVRGEGPRIPAASWKRILKPWLHALVGDGSSNAFGRYAGFAGYKVLIRYLNSHEAGEEPGELGALTLEQAEALPF